MTGDYLKPYQKAVDEAGNGKTERIAERLVLPFATDAATIDYAMSLGVYPYRQTDRDRTPPVWDKVVRIPATEF